MGWFVLWHITVSAMTEQLNEVSNVVQLADDQWQVFTHLDLAGEAEQIKLASFLDSMISSFSGASSARTGSIQALSEDDDAAEEEGGAGGAATGPRSLKLNRGASIAGIASR